MKQLTQLGSPGSITVESFMASGMSAFSFCLTSILVFGMLEQGSFYKPDVLPVIQATLSKH